ncbi:MAG: hypothetical protein RL660_102 [Bacteroidota bacterium]|jgi:hypothetical protein
MEYLLNQEVIDKLVQLVGGAQSSLLMTSPYVDLDPVVQEVLLPKKEVPGFRLRILVKRNDAHIYKCVQRETLLHLLSFDNIDIRQVDKLHTKNYVSDNALLFTSLSLHNFSQDTNVESGIYASKNDGTKAEGKFIDEAAQKLEELFDEATVLYKAITMAGTRTVVADKISHMIKNVAASPVGVKMMSTTQIAKKYNVSQTRVIDLMFQSGLINKKGITELGLTKGLKMQQFGERSFIAYPVNLMELKEL